MTKPNSRLSKKLTALTPTTVARARFDRRMFRKFADKLDFVYFGRVDQRDDEHQVVRGLTLSNAAHDDHFTVGTYHGYDMAFLERVDTIRQPGVPHETRHWLIMTADLHTRTELPHLFIGQSSHSATFYRHVLTKFSYLQKVIFGQNTPADPAFSGHFTVYASPMNALVVEQLLNHELQKMLVAHFSTFSFEIEAGTLYIYTEIIRPTEQDLAKLLQCAAWLASEFDKH